MTVTETEVYPLRNSGYWAWRHQCPKGGWNHRRYCRNEEHAIRQAQAHQRYCDTRTPFLPGMDILMYISPDWRPYSSGG